jgi:eukaryotic-like serine/threonine-protein kinase
VSDATPPALHPTMVGGRYALRGEVGRGGMATVHRAQDQVLDRAVAVKLLHAHLARDPAFLDRFRREARSAAALSHPNVVAVHDWGETDDGPYLVLQLIEGPSLREVLRRQGRLSPGEALGVLGPAGAGLGAAHEAGLVHRDVKPENLLLGRDGSVHVTDFGLARAAASATSTFGADVLMGSPHYLSPEAVRGQPLDPRADVYGLGVVLFECLTGRPPHEGESPYATAVQHTARAVPAPSSLVPELDPAIDEVVRRATSMDPAGRYPDGAAFAAALRWAVPDGPEPLDIDVRDTPGPPPLPDRTGTAIVADEASDTELVGSVQRTRHLDADPRGSTSVTPLTTDGTETDRFTGPRRRRRGWVVLLVLLALVGGSALGGYLLWDRVLAPVTSIPEVLGASQDSATERLVAAGFEVRVADDQPFDLQVPAGHVYEVAPTGQARQGQTITLVLSAGPRQVEVPDVVDDTREDAVTAVTTAGLEPLVVERYDEEVPSGAVIGTRPSAGSVLDETSEVEIVVSIGRQPIEVPSLVGSSLSEAGGVVDDLGLRVEVTGSRFDEQAPRGTILSQAPQPGASVFRGDTVEVVTSNGPEPIQVPNVRGERVEDAVATLRALGFTVEVELRGGFGAFLNPGRVYDQDPAPGATRRKGESVVVFGYEG